MCVTVSLGAPKWLFVSTCAAPGGKEGRVAPDVRGSDGLQLHLRAHLYQKEMFAPLVQHRPLDGNSREFAQGSAHPPHTRMQSRCCQNERARASATGLCPGRFRPAGARPAHKAQAVPRDPPRRSGTADRRSCPCTEPWRRAYLAPRAERLWMDNVRTVSVHPVSNGRAVNVLCVSCLSLGLLYIYI